MTVKDHKNLQIIPSVFSIANFLNKNNDNSPFDKLHQNEKTIK